MAWRAKTHKGNRGGWGKGRIDFSSRRGPSSEGLSLPSGVWLARAGSWRERPARDLNTHLIVFSIRRWSVLLVFIGMPERWFRGRVLDRIGKVSKTCLVHQMGAWFRVCYIVCVCALHHVSVCVCVCVCVPVIVSLTLFALQEEHRAASPSGIFTEMHK